MVDRINNCPCTVSSQQASSVKYSWVVHALLSCQGAKWLMRAVHPVRLSVREKETVTEDDKQTQRCRWTGLLRWQHRESSSDSYRNVLKSSHYSLQHFLSSLRLARTLCNLVMFVSQSRSDYYPQWAPDLPECRMVHICSKSTNTSTIASSNSCLEKYL